MGIFLQLFLFYLSNSQVICPCMDLCCALFYPHLGLAPQGAGHATGWVSAEEKKISKSFEGQRFIPISRSKNYSKF